MRAAGTCGNQDRALAALEFVQCAQALGLAHLPVDGQRVEAQVAQLQRQAPRVLARAREHHERRARQLCEKIGQVAVLRTEEETVQVKCCSSDVMLYS
jgi:hypothetical protein